MMSTEDCDYCGNLKENHKNKYCNACLVLLTYNTQDFHAEDALFKRLLQKRQHRCEACGLSEWFDKPIPLTLHYLDGHSTNQQEANLQLVCRNCDAQLKRNIRVAKQVRARSKKTC